MTPTLELPQSGSAFSWLAGTSTPPTGWESGGLAAAFYSCGAPVLRDKCATGVDIANREGGETFPALPVEQYAVTGTFCNSDIPAHVLQRWNATVDWVLSRQLATDQAGTGAPSLADAVSTGTVTATGEPLVDTVTAVACLIQAGAETGYGSSLTLHLTPRLAVWLQAAGVDLRTQGVKVLVGPGYPDDGTVWLTGQVWAAVDSPDVVETVAHRQNDREAFALGAGIVAFDPCVNLSIVVPVPVCA